jgi:hypothetical protein
MLLLVALGLGIGEAKATTADDVTYIDAGGVERTQNGVTVLDGGYETNFEDATLNGGWYVSTGEGYYADLVFTGDCNLILEDLTVLRAINVYTANPTTANLTIYSQGDDNSGKLYAKGKVNASGSLTINGGRIDIEGGIQATGDITLGWTAHYDYIKCSSCSSYSGTVKTAAGKRFLAYKYESSGHETLFAVYEGGTTIDASELATTVLRPANNYTTAGVSYLKWDASNSKLVPDDQSLIGKKVWELTGYETVLGYAGEETWYVTTSETATFTKPITLNGNVHIILANGTTMNVGTSESPIAGSGIVSTGSSTFYKYNLSIHGQEGSTGKLNVFANGDAGIGVNDLTICGGRITSNSVGDDAYGIFCDGKLVICGGQVTATNTSTTSDYYDPYTIYYSGTVGLKAHEFILGWSDAANDFIQSNSYQVPYNKMRTAEGKSFAVYSISGTTETIEGVIGEASGHTYVNWGNDDEGSYSFAQKALANKIVRPFEGSFVGVGVGQKYLAFNNNNSGFKLLNSDAKLYVVTSVAYNENKFEVGLKEVPEGTVQARVPVIFEGNPLPVNIYLENAEASAVTSLKNFIACDGTKTVAELLTAAGLNDKDMLFFGLSGTSFKRVLLASDDKPAEGKCFLAVPKLAYMDGTLSLGTAAGLSRSIDIDTDGTTSLIDNGQLTMDNSAAAQWYSLDGRRLDKAPKAKGVYIRNGKKLVIK